MAGFNRVTLLGRLTAEPSLRETPSGVAVSNFTLAVDRGFGEEKKVDFFPVVAWRAVAETIAKYVVKGQQILVSGQLQNREWTDKDGNKRVMTEILALEFSFCEGKKEASTQSPQKEQSSTQAQKSAHTGYSQLGLEEVDEDLPF